MLGFRVFARAIRNIWEEMLPLGLMSLLTFVAISLAPALVILVFWVPLPLPVLLLAIPLALPGPPAWMALHVVANKVANEFAIRWDHFFAAFRGSLRSAWPYTLFASLVSGLLIYNVFFYVNAFPDQNWAMWVTGAWLAAMVFWTALQLYVIPFYVEQETKRWRTAFRNAALIAGANPFMTVIVLVLTVAFLVISALLAPPVLVVFGPIIWVMMGTTGVVNRITAYRAAEEAKLEAKETVSKDKYKRIQ